MYRDALPAVQVTTLTIDAGSTNRIFAGTSRGVVLRSDTAGRTWSAVRSFNGNVSQVIMSPSDSHTLYVGVDFIGLWKTTDSGQSWTDITAQIRTVENLSAYPLEFRALAISKAAPNTVMAVVTRFGIIRSTDGGASWSSVKLLTEPGNVGVYALALHPASERIIYYSTASTFYRTIDSGSTWETSRLPSTRVPSRMIVDARDAKKVYMGVQKLTQ